MLLDFLRKMHRSNMHLSEVEGREKGGEEGTMGDKGKARKQRKNKEELSVMSFGKNFPHSLVS